MLPLTTFIGSLPPASLATTDLPRFFARALGRRTSEEIASIRELLGVAALAGYPDELRPAFLTFVERLLAEGHDPDGLDPERVERILASRAFLASVDRRVKLGRQPLRPGTPVSSPLRGTFGAALHVLPGYGPQLVLVTPVDLYRLGQLGWSCVRAPVLARAMDADEAEALRDTWATLEEQWGWDGPEGLVYRARFVHIASRADFDAASAVHTLTALDQDRRVALWDALLEHQRDQELAESRRPGWKGLRARAAARGFELADEALRPLASIAEWAFRSCAPNPGVASGRCPCTAADLAAFAAWADVPDGTRERLAALAPEVVELHLVALAEVEAGRLDLAIDDELRRDIRILRDALLRPRYGRDVGALLGADPLLIARSLLSRGLDRACIVSDLRALREEALEAGRARRPAEADAREAASLADVGIEPGPPVPDALPTLGDNPFAGLGDEPRAPTSRPITGGDGFGPRNPFTEQETSSKPLPPMPRPPPRSRPITTRRIELPPMPEPPPPSRPGSKTHTRPTAPVSPFAAAAAASQRTAPPVSIRPPSAPAAPPSARAPTQPVAPRPAATRPPTTPQVPLPARPRTTPTVPGPSGGVLDGPSAPRPRPAAAPHLVTPAQANRFYETAFRELQILERDLLERGPWQAAIQRVGALDREAEGLAVALGPSARSGDRDFQVSLHRVQLVQSYLARIQPLLDGSGAPTDPEDDELPEEPAPTGVFGRLGRFLKKDKPRVD